MNEETVKTDISDQMPGESDEEAILALGNAISPEELDQALREGEELLLAEPELAGSPHGAAAVRLARGEHGTRGGAKYQQHFGYENVKWCALFVSWAVDMTGNRDHRAPWETPAWVLHIHAWAQARRRLVSRPLHGDIFGLGGQHTGLVAGATPDGSAIYTIEGNITDSVISRNLSSSGLWFARLPD